MQEERTSSNHSDPLVSMIVAMPSSINPTLNPELFLERFVVEKTWLTLRSFDAQVEDDIFLQACLPPRVL